MPKTRIILDEKTKGSENVAKQRYFGTTVINQIRVHDTASFFHFFINHHTIQSYDDLNSNTIKSSIVLNG
jgi:hypothetical protein